MKLPVDKKYLRLSLWALFVIIAAITFEKAIGNINVLWDKLVAIKVLLVSALGPFLYGFFIAYFLNPCMNAIDKGVSWLIKLISRKKPNTGAMRIVAVILTYILFGLCGFWLFWYLVPELIASAKSLVVTIQNSMLYFNPDGPLYVSDTVANEYLGMFNDLFGTEYTVMGLLSMLTEPVMVGLSNLPSFLTNVVSGAFSAVGTIFSIGLGFIIAFYMLCAKESFCRTGTKWVYTIFKPRTAGTIIETAFNAHKTIQSFIVGKTLDSLIIGLIFFAICLILDAPLPLLLAIIIGITNMIPYFGPFIGAAPVLFIVLIYNPFQALIMAGVILALQMFDGYILGPRILGDSTGLKPLAVIFAILLGGATFGFAGMFFGVPIFAVISSMFKTFMDRRFNERYPAVKSDEAKSEPETSE